MSRLWLPGGGRVRSGRFRDAQGQGRGNDPRSRDRFRIAAAGGGFGNIWAFVENADYYDVAINHIVPIPETDDFLIGNQTASVSSGGLKRITPGGAGVELWTYHPSTNMQIGNGRRRSIATDGTYAWVQYRFSTVYRADRVGIDDGVQDWTATMNDWTSLEVDADGLVYGPSVTNTRTKIFDGLSPTSPTMTSFYLSSTLTSLLSCALTDDGLHFATLDSGEQLCFHTVADRPASGTWAAATVIDMTTAPSSPWSAITAEGYVVEAGAGAVWVSSTPNATVYKFDSDGTELAVVTPDNDLGTPGITGVRSICTDVEGNLYVATNLTGDLYFAKYDSDGVFITSNVAQGIGLTCPTNVTDIAVSFLSGTIMITFGDGSESEFSVTS